MPRVGVARGMRLGWGRLCEGRILSDLFVSPNEQRQSLQDRAMPWREKVQFTSHRCLPVSAQCRRRSRRRSDSGDRGPPHGAG